MANSVTTPLQGGFTHHVNNVLGQLTSGQMSTAYSGLTQKTPTKNFTFTYLGQHISFENGHPVMCSTALAAALVAAGAPVV